MRKPRVLVVARSYPNNAFPSMGIWTERIVSASRAVADPTVLAPVPYAPPFVPSRAIRRFRSVDRVRTHNGVLVYHPRVPAGPGHLLHWLDARLGLSVLLRQATALHAADPFDVIHAHFIYPEGVMAAAIGASLGLPVVTSEHSMWRPWLDDHRAVRRQVERALPHIARVTAVSDALRADIVSLMGSGVRVEVMPNVVDERMFTLPEDPSTRDPDHLLFVGLVRRVKGLDVLVRALAHLIPTNPNLRLSVVGAAFYRASAREAAEVRALATALGLDGHIRFVGEMPPNEVARMMRESALLVVPSRRETFSLVTAEALASGTPVVATRCGGPEEILPPDMGGLANVDDPQGLALAIERELTRSHDREAMRAYSVERFGTAAAADRLGRLYASVIDAAAGQRVHAARREPPSVLLVPPVRT